MTPEEILEKYEVLKLRSRKLVDEGNDIWADQEILRAEYKKLTGKRI